MEEKIDKTINNICDWIDRSLSENPYEEAIVPQMISALAELVKARAEVLSR